MAPTIISSVVVQPKAAANATGNALDLVSLADVKLELGLTDGANDPWLAKVITRASREIAAYCNRTFQVRTIQDQIWAYRDAFPWQLPPAIMPLQLSGWPIASPPSPANTAPPLAPTLSSVSGGALAGATYYAKITYVTPSGETAASLESSLAVAANNLVQVASPIADSAALATGWNVYLGTSSFAETKQNASPLALGAAFTLPTTGLLTEGADPLPAYMTVVENAPLQPAPLIEGVDFKSDYDSGPQPKSVGWLTRLFPMDASPRIWSGLPVTVQYQAGYATIPDDLQDAAIQLVKMRYFARGRDPMLRSENVEGAWSAQYWFGAGPGADNGGLPPMVTALIDQYRVPVIG